MKLFHSRAFLYLLIVFFIGGLASIIIWPAGCPSWKRRQMHSRHVLEQYVKLVAHYESVNSGKLPNDVSDVLNKELSVDFRRQQLCRAGIDQSWKPKCWYTNNAVVAALSDYVFIPYGTNHLIIAERPLGSPGEMIQYVNYSNEGFSPIYLFKIGKGNSFFNRLGINDNKPK